jgi:hypothetical protein
MNITVYLFGEFNNGYTQYPDDYTNTKFKTLYSNAKSTTQIVIHREGDLMYYGYIRKLEQDRYIGFCVVINGLMLTKLDGLFSLFENTISKLVTNGQLIYFNKEGNIVTSVDKLYMNLEEIDLLTESFRAGFHHFMGSVKALPAINYSISKESIKNLSIEENIDEIIRSSHTYSYTFIYKSKGFNTNQLNSYKEVLNKLNIEKVELSNKNDDLKKVLEKTIREKKQNHIIAILFFVVLICLIIFISLNSNLNKTKSDLKIADSTISEQSSILNFNDSKITTLETENLSLKNEYQITKKNFDSLQAIVSYRQPFIIKSTSFDFNTGYLTFNYYGFKNELVKLEVRVYDDFGNSLTKTTDVNIYTGENTNQIFLNLGLNYNEWYSFVILQNNIIIGGDRH